MNFDRADSIRTRGGYPSHLIQSSVGVGEDVTEVSRQGVNRQQLERSSGKAAIKEIKSKGKFTEFELANGLTLIFKKNNSPAISARLVVTSGSQDDPEDKQGLAHFLEHMIIQYNSEFDGYLSQVVHRNGGQFNAGTGMNSTNYSLTLPQDKLELVLRIFRAYLSPLEFSDDDVSREASIITKEIKKRNSNLVNRLEQCFADNLYGVDHRESRPVIGKVESVCSISKTDLEEAHRRNYVPNRSTLVISGDFGNNEVQEKVVRCLADLQSGTNIEDQEPLVIKDLEGSISEVEDASLIPTLSLAIRLPENQSVRDEQIFAVISKALILRLVDKFIHESDNDKPINGIKDYKTTFKGLYLLSLGLLGNVDLESLKAEIENELKDIRENGIKDSELQRIIQSLRVENIYEADHPGAGIGEIVSCVKNNQDWSQVIGKLNTYSSITNGEICAYLQRFKAWDKPYYIHTTGRGEAPAVAVEDDSNGQILNPKKMLDKSDPERIKALSGGYSKIDLKLKSLQKFRSSDTDVFLKEDHNIPLVFSNFSFNGNLLSVPKDKERGLLLLRRMLMEGTCNKETGVTYSRKELSDRLEELGLKLQLEYEADTCNIRFSMISDNFDESLAILDEIFNHSNLMKIDDDKVRAELETKLESFKGLLISSLKNEAKNPDLALYDEFTRLLFPGGHLLYENPLEKKIEEIQALTLDDMRSMYKKIFAKGISNAAVVGDITREKLGKLISVFDSSAESKHSLAFECPDAIERNDPVYKVIEADASQSESLIEFGNSVEIKENDDDFIPALLINLILGDNSSSRIFRELRMKLGLVYSANSSFLSSLNYPGLFCVKLACDPNHLSEVLNSALSLIDDFVDNGITEDELELAKSRLKTRAAMSHLSNLSNTCETLADLQLREKDQDYINGYSDMIDSISLEQVCSAIKRLIKPKNFSMVISKPKWVDFGDCLSTRGYQQVA